MVIFAIEKCLESKSLKMKNRIALNLLRVVTIIFFYISCSIKAQTIPKVIKIESQAQLDSLSIRYKNLKIYKGNIFINGKDINSLSGLRNITEIHGKLSITNTSIESLSGLKSIKKINSLTIRTCNELKNLKGLRSLKSVNELDISYNDKLESIKSLTSIDSVFEKSGKLQISHCKSLKSLKGLNNVKKVYRLNIDNNPLIKSLEDLKSLKHAFEVSVTGNESLTDISSLNNLESTERFNILFNHKLSKCNLERICDLINQNKFDGVINNNGPNCLSIDEVYKNCGYELSDCPKYSFQFTSQMEVDKFKIDYPNCKELEKLTILDKTGDITNLEAFSNIEKITNYLQIINTGLKDLSGFKKLKTIGGKLYISKNDELKTLEGMNNLTSIGDGFSLLSCNKLTNLMGFYNINSFSLDEKRHVGYIAGCNNLENLRGLENGEESKLELKIINNEKLKDISAISKWTQIQGITLEDNFKLENCDIEAIKRLKTNNKFVKITNNGKNCN